MEFQPQSQTGKLLVSVLDAWMKKSSEFALDKLKQMLDTKAVKVKNSDRFVAALYSQHVLDETPSVLSQSFPSALLRVQYVMEITLNKNCAKEFVVALELSENQSLLCEICGWTAKHSGEIQESMKRASSVGLASVKVQKRKVLSEMWSGTTVASRYREISWIGEEKDCTVLEVSNVNIIVGWNNGQIGIYNSSSLNCEMMLNYGGNSVPVTCLQSTDTEIIAGYEDGNICLWYIHRGFLVQSLSMEIGNCPRHFPTCMRWKDSKLIAGTAHGRIHIWQDMKSSFTVLSSWDAGIRHIRAVDFNENYVILGPPCETETVEIHDFNGHKIRSISSRGGILQMAFRVNHIVTCSRWGALQIWDISTGNCLKELIEHGIYMFGFDPDNGVIASGNRGTEVTIWKMEAALEGSQTKLVSLPHRRIKCVPFDGTVDDIKLGPNFLVATSDELQHQKKIFVTEFLS